MIARSDTVLDEYERQVPGALVYVYNADGTAASLTSDGVTTLVQPIVTDEFGGYSYQANVGYYREDIWFGGKLRYQQNNIAIGSPGADLALRTDLAASTGSGLVEYQSGATGSAARTVASKLGDIDSVADFPNHATADAAGKVLYTPVNIASTRANGAAVVSRHWGPGQVTTADGNKRGAWFSSVSAAPTYTGSENSVDTAFDGDFSKSQIAMEHRITGAATLGQPTTGYVYTPPAYPHYLYFTNSSGWNNGTADNVGRTAAVGFRIKGDHTGQGDLMGIDAVITVNGARAGATHFFANPAGAIITGETFAEQPGVYCQNSEMDIDDQGFDVAGVADVRNMKRTNNTGALSAVWLGYRLQSIGTKAIDAGVSMSGLINVGIDLTPSNFGTNQAAIALVRGQRIYGNAATTDPNLLKATSLGTDYFTNSASGWDFTVGGVLAGRIGATGIGYPTGSGGAVTQATSKSTAVTLNKPCGQITLNAASLAASTVVSFTFTNSNIAATDIIRINTSGAATPGSYLVQAENLAAGSCTVSVRNLTAGALAEALVLNFAIIKAANA
jgi:hypothetical protein